MVLVDIVYSIFGLGLQYLVGAFCAYVVLGGGIGFCGLCRLSASLMYLCSMCGSLAVAFSVLLVCVCVLLVGCVIISAYRCCVVIWFRVLYLA
jgi:hypothetical protein